MPRIDTDVENWMTGYDDYEDYMSEDEYENFINTLNAHENYGINARSSNKNDYVAITKSIGGIFGMPYQFSSLVDPEIEVTKLSSGNNKRNDSLTGVGRKFSEKILSVMPVLFLTPGEPLFMAGYSKSGKEKIALRLMTAGDDDGGSSELDEGRYYSFVSNFPEYKKYANMALRALALYMGIENTEIPVPGSTKLVKLKKIDVEAFMSNDFTKLFGSQCVVPFFLDAETSISEDFGNDTAESMIASTTNQFSSTARELQFMMGSKDQGGLVGAIGDAVNSVGDLTADLADSLGEVVSGKKGNLLSKVTNELTTIVSGGKIVFPEIWNSSSYSKNYSINLKLRSPDPDPVSIFLNIYMPIVLLISMTAPRQLGNSSNAYESPFLVRATYKSIFNCDLGIITSLSITKGGSDKWNVMGMPVTADVSITLTDLYKDFFISKRMGMINNTAQLDYLATMAGTDLNELEPTRMIKLWSIILGDAPRDFASDAWGGIKRTLNQKASNVLSVFGDTRFLQ